MIRHLETSMISVAATLLASGLQSSSNLIQCLLNPIQFQLGRVREMPNALWRLFQMMADVSDDFPATLAHQEDANTTQKHTQTAHAKSELFALSHPFRDPRFALP